MRPHVFVVDDETFPVHRDRQFCGTGLEGVPQDYDDVLAAGRRYLGLIADLKGTRVGDPVFLYHRQRGFRGIYRITGEPFFDPTEIPGVGQFAQHTVPASITFRVPVECVEYFEEPVPEDMAFATPEYESLFWVWFYRKISGRGRGCTTINPEAGKTLIDLLIKVNGIASEKPPTGNYPQTARQELILPIWSGQQPLEDALRGWLIEHLDDERSDLRQIFGPVSDLEWFANNVPYHVAMRNIDVLVFHASREYTDEPLRYRYSVVELKRGRARSADLAQLIEYAKWAGGRLAGGEVDIVQPILIAKSFSQDAIDAARNSVFNRLGVKLVVYEVEGDQSLCFAGVSSSLTMPPSQRYF